jgi:hypothetical protein
MIQDMPGKVIPFPVRPAPAPRDERALVEVHRCDQREALVVKGLFTVGAQGEVTLLVPQSDADRSRQLLAV